MKLELNFQKFKDAILSIDRIASRHLTLPVLSCILVEVKKNTASFKATNLDIGAEVILPVKTDEEGIIAIPASVISSFVSQIQANNQLVTLEIISGNLSVTAAKVKGLIKTLPPEDFPSIPSITEGESFSMPTELFIKGLKSVWYSSSVSGVKPELSSVYVYKDADNLVFAATDSFRLAEKKIKAPAASKIGELLIPFKNIPDILRLLENMGPTVEVETNKNLITFRARDIYLVSRLIDGVFPDYRQIIPKGFSTEAVILKQDLVNALKISNIFSDKFNQVHFTIDPKGKLFEIQTKNNDIGENKIAVDAALTGEKVEINFNYKYIVDCFQSIEADSVALQLGGMNRPMVVRPISGDQSFMYLVMPMNR